jgi:tRNA(fMet)-specific endonuclease VapC
MIRRYMLDTNIVSYIVKGDSPHARAKLATLAIDEVACISTVTEAELRYGIAKRPHRKQLNTALDLLLGTVEVLDWGRPEAAMYGQLRASQEALGKPLDSMDTLIGAHALSVGAVLVTNDKAFSKLPQLTILNWATDVQ